METPALLDVINLSTIGLAFDIVGVIFLANSIGIRQPRRFIQEHFGIQRPQQLRSVLDQLRAKAEIFTGFLFLMVGFSLQIIAELAPDLLAGTVVDGSDAPALRQTQILAFAMLASVVLATTLLLRVACRLWSLRLFRKLLAEFLTDQGDWNFERHPDVTREIGEILAVPADEEDSIGDYAGRVRAALGLAAQAPRRAVRDDAFAVARQMGAERHR
jgi:hypothetical protein